MPISIAQMPRRRISAEGIFAAINVVLENHKRQAGQSIFLTLNPRIRNLLLRLRVRLPAPNFDQVSQNISQEVAQETLENVPKVADLAQTPQVVADSLIETLLVEPQIEAPLKKYQDNPEKLLPQVAPIANDVATIHQKDLETAAVLGKISQIGTIVESSPEIKAALDETIEETVIAEHPTATQEDLSQTKLAGTTYLKDYATEIGTRVLPAISQSRIPTFVELQKLQEQAHQKASAVFQTKMAQNVASAQLTPSEITSNVAYDFGLRPETTDDLNRKGLGPAQQTATSLSSSAPLTQKSIGVALAINSDLADNALDSLLPADRPRLEKTIKFFEGEIAKAQGRPAPSYRQLKKLREIKGLLVKLRSTQKFSPSKRAQNLRNFFANLLPPGERLRWATAIAWQSFLSPKVFVPRYLRQKSFAPQRMIRAMAYQLGNYRMGKRAIIRLGQSPFIPIRIISLTTIVTLPVRLMGGLLSGVGRIMQGAGRSIALTLGRIPIIGIPFAVFGAGLSGFGKVLGGFGRILSAFGRFGGLGGSTASQTGGPAGIASGAIASVASVITLPMRNTVNLVKRAAAAVGAGLGFLFYLFGIKILGAIAGFGFGLITGLPLLLIPGIGPILYAGWVTLWTFVGFNNPQLMFNIWDGILHPVDTLGRIFGPVGEALGPPGQTVLSFLGNGIFGGFQFLVNGLIAAGEGFIGFLGAAADFILSIGSMTISTAVVGVSIFAALTAVIASVFVFVVTREKPAAGSDLIAKTAQVDSSGNIAYKIAVFDNCPPNFKVTDTLPANLKVAEDQNANQTYNIINSDAVDSVSLDTPQKLTKDYTGPIIWSVKLKQTYVDNCQNKPSPTSQPKPTGQLPFYILYGDTSINVQDPQAIKNLANRGWPVNHIDKWDYVIQHSIDSGLSPAFVVSIWWEEGGFGGAGNSEFGCYTGGNTSLHMDFDSSFNCFIDFSTRQHPYDPNNPEASYDNWEKYFCGPDAVPICSNNPNHLRNICNVYNTVAPGKLVGKCP